MGNPLSPILACLVLDDLLSTMMPKLKTRPIIIKKYVDDLFAIVPIDHIVDIKLIFERYHPRIRFTYESEVDGKIPYLDMLIHHNEDRTLSIDWYSKPVSTNRILSFHSHHAWSYKVGTAKGLINRVLSLSDECFWENNIQRIKDILIMNGYPMNLISKWIMLRVNGDVNRTSIDLNNKRFHSVIYVRGLSEEISKLFSKQAPNICVAHKNYKTVRDLFTHKKDKIEDKYHSNIVYNIQCDECNKCYIGETERHKEVRMTEHTKSLGKEIQTAVVDHHAKTGHSFQFKTAKTIDREANTQKRRILESLHILKTKNTCNFKVKSDKVNCCYPNLVNLRYNNTQSP